MSKIIFNNLEELKSILKRNFDITLIKRKSNHEHEFILTANNSNMLSYDDHGLRYSFEDKYHQLVNKPYTKFFLKYNILNKMYGKKNVPTVYMHQYTKTSLPVGLYCSECKHGSKDYDLSGYIVIKPKKADNIKRQRRAKLEKLNCWCIRDKESTIIIKIEKIKCENCGTEYDLRDVKYIIDGDKERIISEVYYDKEKISFSNKYIFYEVGKEDIFFNEGYYRETLNIKTGFSYFYGKGHAKKAYENKGPILRNSTYVSISSRNGAGDSVYAKCNKDLIYDLMNNNADVETVIYTIDNMYNIIKKKKMALVNKTARIIKEMIKDFHNIDIPDIKKVYKNNKKYDDYYIFASDEEYNIDTLKKYNRFPFISHNHINTMIVNDLMKDKNGRVHFNRWAKNFYKEVLKNNNIAYGKGTLKILNRNDNHSVTMAIFNYCGGFKNKENVLKVAKAIEKNSIHSTYYYWNKNHTLEWLKYRSENYISNKICSLLNKIEEERNRSSKEPLMIPYALHPVDSKAIDEIKIILDGLDMSINMGKELGKNRNISELVPFKNEINFHDDLIELQNSDLYKEIVMNEDCNKYKLEKKDIKLENDIFKIVREPYTLQDIGSKMRNCVRTYSDRIKSGHCRIFYMGDDSKYECCIEIEKRTNKYSLIQAKLFANKPAYNDEHINNEIIKWCKDNKITIKTSDISKGKYVEAGEF